MFSDTRYRCVLHSVRASNGAAAEVTDGANLVDGRPSTLCSIKWIGATSADYMEIIVRVVPTEPGLSNPPESRMFYIQGGASLPPRTLAAMRAGSSLSTLNHVWLSTMDPLPNGRTGTWVTRPFLQGNAVEYFAFRIYNSAGGVPWITPGSYLQIGEIYAGPVIEWPASDLEIKVTDLSLTNEASDGTIRRVKRTPQRQVTVTIPPTSFDRAVSGTGGGTLQDFLYRLIASDTVAIVGLPQLRGVQDTALWRGTGFLGCLQDSGTLKLNSASKYAAPLTLTFKEAL
jgi:hypothetical protein